MGNSSSKNPMGNLPKNLVMPPRVEVYHAGTFKSSMSINASRNEPLYHAVIRKAGMGQLELYQGSNADGPCLAVMENRNVIKMSYTARLADGQAYECKKANLLGEGLKFTVPVGEDGRPEEFAWHSAKRSEVAPLGGSTFFGMKLIRESGPRKGEIVALWSHPELSKSSWHNAAVFGFAADGQQLGIEFSVTALLTFLQIYQTRLMNTMAAITSSNSAGAAAAISG
jgi:hypothetical protein